MVEDSRATLGLVLNGGRARRMGGVDKGLMPLAGRPMIVHAIGRLGQQVAKLAISANAPSIQLAAFGLPVLLDDPPGRHGPLAGVLAGLEFALQSASPLAYVASLPADTPFAPCDFIARLHAARRAGGGAIAVAVSGDHTHHLVALWPVEIASSLRRFLRDEDLRSVGQFARRLGVTTVEWPIGALDPFTNVNSLQDLAAAETNLFAAAETANRPECGP
jgi:molybdopterin-guanine dinucleotide biosynthesis protein A